MPLVSSPSFKRSRGPFLAVRCPPGTKVPSLLADRYAFYPEIDLRVDGPAYTRRHFQREYGPAEAEGAGAPSLEVLFKRSLPDAAEVVVDRYKTVRWRVALSDPAGPQLRATISLSGGPRSFGLSLLQGWLVEPLLSLAAARAGQVLLPAAAIEEGDGALALMGGSGSGKTSVSLRALAAGRGIVGDDQFLLDADGLCRRLPRRLRLYSDVPLTAPEAFARLPARARAALRGREVLRRVSRNSARPSLPVDVAALGRPLAGPLELRRVVLIERRNDVDDLKTAVTDAEAAVTQALGLLDAQRARLPRAGGWEEEIAGTRDAERQTLTVAIARLPVEQLTLPAAWPAPKAVCRLAEVLGIGQRRR